jgi:metal-dependent amidase/aminoacylase/carboxypeptidase family protein
VAQGPLPVGRRAHPEVPGPPHPAVALARAITSIAAIEAPRAPETRQSWINVSMLSGAGVVNAMPSDAWFTVDVRSNSPEMLERLVRAVREAPSAPRERPASRWPRRRS